MENLIKNLANALEIEDVSSLNSSTDFKQLPEWGSMSLLALIAMLDEEYGIEAEVSEISELNTVSDLEGFIRNRC